MKMRQRLSFLNFVHFTKLSIIFGANTIQARQKRNSKLRNTFFKQLE